MSDERNARRPEMRIGLGTGNLSGEFRRESSENSRRMYAGFFKDAALEQRHPATAAIGAGRVLALPGRGNEAAGRRTPRCERAGAIDFKRLEGGADFGL